MVLNGWNGWKWLEMAGMAWNGWKLLAMAVNGRISCQWLFSFFILFRGIFYIHALRVFVLYSYRGEEQNTTETSIAKSFRQGWYILQQFILTPHNNFFFQSLKGKTFEVIRLTKQKILKNKSPSFQSTPNRAFKTSFTFFVFLFNFVSKKISAVKSLDP